MPQTPQHSICAVGAVQSHDRLTFHALLKDGVGPTSRCATHRELMLRLQSMLDFHDVDHIEDLGSLISRWTLADGTGAFWLHRDGVCELALFLNGSRAAVYRDTDGSWSHTPGASEDECDQFMLENGQVDEIPLSQCVGIEDGIAAFLETAATGKLSARIAWD